MLQDRLRKATDDNRELAANLRREAEVAQRALQKPSKRRTTGGSDFNSLRDSEERQSSVPGRGTKRARDAEIEKVGLHVFFLLSAYQWSEIVPSILQATPKSRLEKDIFSLSIMLYLRGYSYTQFSGISVVTISL